MYRLSHFFLLMCLSYLIVACGPSEELEEEVVLTEVKIDLDSAVFQQLYDFKDRWQADSLVPYFQHRDPSFRTFSASLFSDIISSKYIDYLGPLVEDPIVEVRRAALYSLGQSRDPKSVPYIMQIFSNQDSLGVDPLSFKYALEAVGKCADSSYLESLATISTYQPSDQLLLEGQSLGILQMGIRGFSHPQATELMVKYVTDTLFPTSVRGMAAQHLAVSQSVDLSSYDQSLISCLDDETNVDIRMFLAECMGKVGTKGYQWLARNFSREKDYRVKIQMLRASLYLPRQQMHNILVNGLQDRNLYVSTTASELLIERGSSMYAKTYTNWAFGNFPIEVKANVFAMVNKYNDNSRFKTMTQQLLLQEYRKTNDDFVRAALIKACAYSSSTQGQLVRWYSPDHNPIVITSIIEALIAMGKDNPSVLNSSSLGLLKELWMSGDLAAVSLISPFIAKHEEVFEEFAKDDLIWKKLMDKIAMPGGVEAMISLKKAYASVFNEDFDPHFYQSQANYTHPIDWNLYSRLSDETKAEITTSKGVFNILLEKKHAPGTVVNFVELAESGYYNNKIFHRIVPNFVVQGGGNRGDGYGSLDYTIRSELGPKYFDGSGWLGMASAGMHTESQQWFVTQRPTPHLNGKYTIFGKVIDHMEVILKLEQGDIIQGITIKK